MNLERTYKEDPRFLALVDMLDYDLACRYSNGNVEHAPLNSLQNVIAVVLALEGDEPVGCGAFKPFHGIGAEIKRVFVRPGFRGRGISKAILAELEKWAGEMGYSRAVLETGIRQPEAVALYESIGYRRIENFEPYAGREESLCYEKSLRPIEEGFVIRPYQKGDFPGCVGIFRAAYNGEPWHNHWAEETAARYLSELAEARHFTAWVALDNGRLTGALFAHRKTWWTQDELFADEFFVHPDDQGRGLGKRLLKTAEEYCVREGLAGVTLLTDRRMPAMEFYGRNGYEVAGHVAFLYKVVNESHP